MFSAITRLGFYEVYCIVTAMVASRSLSIAPKNSGLDVGKLWEHSVTTAVAASALARRSGELEALAFTSGLLHDIGKLVLAAVEPARYPQLLQTHGLGGPDLLTAEIELFKVSHAMIGAELLSRWKLPSSVIIPVLKHHDKASDIHSLRGLWASVRLGNSIAHSLKNDTVDHPDRATEILETLDILEINANDLPAVISDISENLEKVKGLLV
jgi:putative nucleotidyltransferase with HDIG domain